MVSNMSPIPLGCLTCKSRLSVSYRTSIIGAAFQGVESDAIQSGTLDLFRSAPDTCIFRASLRNTARKCIGAVGSIQVGTFVQVRRTPDRIWPDASARLLQIEPAAGEAGSDFQPRIKPPSVPVLRPTSRTNTSVGRTNTSVDRFHQR
jgi:hypothetical protein